MSTRKKIVNYSVNYYDCNAVINDHWFVGLEISQYYKTKRGRSTVSDEIIQKLVKELDKLRDRKFLRDDKYYSFNRLYISYRAYNLVWDYDESPLNTTLLIIDCYRERKFDKPQKHDK